MEELTKKLDRLYEDYNKTHKEIYKIAWYNMIKEADLHVYYMFGRMKFIA